MHVLEIFKIADECGSPELTVIYDEEAVEEWVWSHPDGRTWTATGLYVPNHPLFDEVSRDELAEEIHRWLEANFFLTEDIIEEQASLLVMDKDSLITKYLGAI